MLFLKSFLITTILASISIRDPKIGDIYDYEVMVGGHNEQFSFEIERERQDGAYYNYQQVRYKYDFNENRYMSVGILNNEEDDIELYDLTLLNRLPPYLSLGAGLASNGEHINVCGVLHISYKDKLSYKYLQTFDYFMHELILKYSKDISEKLSIVPKLKYINFDKKEDFQFKIEIAYKIKSVS